MGYLDRARVFDMPTVAPQERPREAKWPLYYTFWAVTLFCSLAWAAIIGMVLALI
jgi:hypothetical protein